MTNKTTEETPEQANDFSAAQASAPAAFSASDERGPIAMVSSADGSQHVAPKENFAFPKYTPAPTPEPIAAAPLSPVSMQDEAPEMVASSVDMAEEPKKPFPSFSFPPVPASAGQAKKHQVAFPSLLSLKSGADANAEAAAPEPARPAFTPPASFTPVETAVVPEPVPFAAEPHIAAVTEIQEQQNNNVPPFAAEEVIPEQPAFLEQPASSEQPVSNAFSPWGSFDSGMTQGLTTQAAPVTPVFTAPTPSSDVPFPTMDNSFAGFAPFQAFAPASASKAPEPTPFLSTESPLLPADTPEASSQFEFPTAFAPEPVSPSIVEPVMSLESLEKRKEDEIEAEQPVNPMPGLGASAFGIASPVVEKTAVEEESKALAEALNTAPAIKVPDLSMPTDEELEAESQSEQLSQPSAAPAIGLQSFGFPIAAENSENVANAPAAWPIQQAEAVPQTEEVKTETVDEAENAHAMNAAVASEIEAPLASENHVEEALPEQALQDATVQENASDEAFDEALVEEELAASPFAIMPMEEAAPAAFAPPQPVKPAQESLLMPYAILPEGEVTKSFSTEISFETAPQDNNLRYYSDDEIQRILSDHEAWLQTGGESGRRANFRLANLMGIDLSSAVLVEAGFRGANLTGANLSQSDLRGADLSEADLKQANVSYVNLEGAMLTGADLRESTFEGSHLASVDFANAQMAGLNLAALNLAGANCYEANMQGVDLRQANMSGANLREAILIQANLEQADLSDANLRDANCEGAVFNYARMDGALLRNTNLANASVLGLNLGNATESSADQGLESAQLIREQLNQEWEQLRAQQEQLLQLQTNVQQREIAVQTERQQVERYKRDINKQLERFEGVMAQMHQIMGMHLSREKTLRYLAVFWFLFLVGAFAGIFMLISGLNLQQLNLMELGVVFAAAGLVLLLFVATLVSSIKLSSNLKRLSDIYAEAFTGQGE